MNKVFLVGRLGDKPQRLNEKVVSFDVATTTSKKDEPTWHRVKAFNELAQQCERFLAKGREVVVEGSINNYKYEKNGVQQRGSEVLASRVVFVGGGTETKRRQETGLETVRMSDVKTPDAFDGLPW